MSGALQYLGPSKDGKNGRWKVIVYAGGGKQRSRVIHAKNEQAAERAADAVRAQLRQEIAHGIPKGQSVREVVERWLRDNELTKSPTTMKGYRIIARRIIDEFGTMQVGALTSADVRDWYTRLATGDPKRGVPKMSQATLEHHHAVLRIILRQAQADDLVTKVATFGVKRPKPAKKEIQLPKDAAMLALLGAARGDAGVGVRLSAATGMRRGELMGLRWSDIRGRSVHVCRVVIESGDGMEVRDMTKGKRDREVLLDGGTLRVLARHRRQQVDQAAQLGVVLDVRADRMVLANMEVDPTGQTPFTPSWLSHSWQSVRKANGGARVRLHDLRHWYATTILRSGEVTIVDLSRMLGHSKVSTTLDIYGHAAPEQLQAAARVMGGALRGLDAPRPRALALPAGR